MISTIRGIVLHASADLLVIEVGGVGFSVSVPTEVAMDAREGQERLLFTQLIVREDALSLYGFAQREQLAVFSTLLGVTGIGPRSALGVLSSLSIDQIAHAVADEDDRPFRKVSGIGPKTAKLITVQLQGKLAPSSRANTPPAQPGAPASVAADLVTALTGLGWTERAAQEAAEQTVADAPEGDRGNVALLLRRTLAALGPGGVRG